MKDEEFVKLRFWLDAELTFLRIMMSIILGLLVGNTIGWLIVGLYIFVSTVYAGSRLNFVERKHRGYMRIKDQ